MRKKFGWDLPPGVTNRMIEEQAGAFEIKGGTAMTKYTNDEIKDIVDIEGLEYTVCHYLSSDTIEDETLAEMWERAAVAMQEISAYLDLDY